MKNVSKLYIPLLFIAFLTSLYLKDMSIIPLGESTSKKPHVHGAQWVKSVKPVNRGNFEIHFYQSTNCDGILALIALDKNEEGAAILAHYLKRPLNDILFILDAKTYSQFPALNYWSKSLNPFSPARSVLAVKEFGSCKMIEKTDWSQI